MRIKLVVLERIVKSNNKLPLFSFFGILCPTLKQVSEENLGASSGGGGPEGGQSGHKKLILKRESCSCDSGDRVSDAGSRRSKSIGEKQSFICFFFSDFLKKDREVFTKQSALLLTAFKLKFNLFRGAGGRIRESKEANIQH